MQKNNVKSLSLSQKNTQIMPRKEKERQPSSRLTLLLAITKKERTTKTQEMLIRFVLVEI